MSEGVEPRAHGEGGCQLRRGKSASAVERVEAYSRNLN